MRLLSLGFRPGGPLWRMAFWLAAAAVLALSLTPVDHLPPRWFDWWDKAQHALGFAGLSALGLMAYHRHAQRVATGLLVFGVVIECAQAATGWRHGDVLDWIADAVGVIGAMAIHRYWPRQARPT